MEATQKLKRRIEFERAIELDEEETPVQQIQETIRQGGCEIDSSYTGPVLPPANEVDAGRGKKYGIDTSFIAKMEEWFKSGKNLARRVAWEIVLGCYEACMQEESLNEVILKEGMTCDVIGDTHGNAHLKSVAHELTVQLSRPILRPPSSLIIDRTSLSRALSSIQWRLCGPRIVVDRSCANSNGVEMVVSPQCAFK